MTLMLQVLLDELVLPDDTIVNYNTAYSGASQQHCKCLTYVLAQRSAVVSHTAYLSFVGFINSEA